MPVTERTFTTTPSQLATALTRLADPPVVGVDVERADANRYWRRPALIQLGVDGQVVLVDPLAIEDLEPLNRFLRARTVVLHAMENDIAPLLSVSVAPTVVEDTAVAAAVLGLPTGLENLLDQLLGVSFNGDKQRMQRADWAKRPLSDAMLEYAAADVADLPQLWTVLADRLAATGRRTWYEQERDALRGLPPIEERRSWTRLRGLGRLDRRAQTRARSLWQMRETLARDTDTAPNRILSDRALLDLAAKPVTDARGLRARGMRRQSTRRFGDQLLEALKSAKDAMPITSAPRRLDERDRTIVDRLRARRSQIAEREQLDPGVLCPNRALERAVVLHPTTPEELREALDLRPWQWELMVGAFVEALDLAAPGTPSLSSAPVRTAQAASGTATATAPDHAATRSTPIPTKDQAMADVLNPDALHHEIDRLDGWEGTTKEGISKRYTFDDFAGSIAFVNRVAEHAEQAGHHPDLAISWDTVTVTYITHSAGGVTQADIEQARAIDGLPH